MIPTAHATARFPMPEGYLQTLRCGHARCMVQGMARRHFFDNGYPVTPATLVAGSHVLLAVSRQSLRKSRSRLGASLLQIADTSQRVMHTLASHLFRNAEKALNARAEVQAGACP